MTSSGDPEGRAHGDILEELTRQAGIDTQAKGSDGQCPMQHCQVKVDGGIAIAEAQRLQRTLWAKSCVKAG